MAFNTLGSRREKSIRPPSAQERLIRPVTPEVAGSSPVVQDELLSLIGKRFGGRPSAASESREWLELNGTRWEFLQLRVSSSSSGRSSSAPRHRPRRSTARVTRSLSICRDQDRRTI